MIISSYIRPHGGNEAGIDANVALLGMGFLIYAVFNGLFLPSFYKSGYKIGGAFLKASVGVFVLVGVDVFIPHIITWLDGYDVKQWIVLVACIVIYGVITLLACKKAERNYEKVDL